MPATDRRRGFTLVEVLVALAIVSVSLLAVFMAIGETINNATYLLDRSFAGWIADNRITEVRLSGVYPSVEQTEGDVEYAGRNWHWVQKVSQTPVDGMRRIDVTVRRETDAEGAPLASLAGFVGMTATTTGPSSRPWNVGALEDGGDGDGDGDSDDDDGDT